MFQVLAGKRALWEQGFRPIQITAVNHGFSRTRFGEAAINGHVRRTEDRYLKDRIIFDYDDTVAVTRKIVDLLNRGELVLMTNNFYSGSFFVELEFGANGYVSMPTAPLSIVARLGVPFFSMAILETEPLAKMTATVETIHPGDRDRSRRPVGRRDYARMAQLAVTARNQLFEQFRRAPEQHIDPSILVGTRLKPAERPR
jgi:hypothetical protein